MVRDIACPGPEPARSGFRGQEEGETVFRVSRTVITLLTIISLCGLSRARSLERNTIREALDPDEVAVINTTIENWRDAVSIPGTLDAYTDEDLLADYKRFSRLISDMPSPGTGGEYPDIDQVESFGGHLTEIFQRMPFSAFERYEQLVGLMRDVMAIDLRYLRSIKSGTAGPEARRSYRTHLKAVKAADEEYLRYVVGIWGADGGSPGFEKQGYGTAKLPDGSFYKGQFRQGLFNGQGVLVKNNGYRYEGEFKDGFPHGTGVEILGDGTRYEGRFKDGRWHGAGTVVWKDGTRYEGRFRDGKLLRP
ncbi:MAG: hypothetical protein GF392_04465 [Candidatus Omnitrophica bacterium]|nr:hypothetical protein [Candidatus Omnitrophota bacterium]